ncbi:hypothetical protein TVAG_114180 [Trichomonas vaginalis G3]|uniref:Uncharacterized protein n=1 Tax=Trichomonas vaginalis (strain ATCC PRA-98 / G3) TaxID=412133 RepID=A2F3U5_TRIV3|nr:hypothetical protein TVAGG3_0281070 [Trichomonas vaginalis G3]EAY00414.1 hypothetical protein TVAG_114180 [Trichomonas vaginalis G3]KAI5526548.1 hypothetical protein TVAGG3_0281070 [Trichomonas vaginalis G3]|eukprot:XP_001313343.1 hypothetical protein [Trichomonas vaginalis G3]
MNSLEQLEPVPLAENESDVPPMALQLMDISSLKSTLIQFFLIALAPLLFAYFYPNKYRVLSYSQLQPESLENPSNHFLFIIQNLDVYHDSIRASFQLFNQNKKIETMNLTAKISTFNRKMHESSPKIYETDIVTNSTMPKEVFSALLSDTRVVNIDISFPPNSSAVSRINCFIEYTPSPRVHFELATNLCISLILGCLFYNIYISIEKTKYIRPAQFVTEFLLALILISSIPVDILRPYVSNVFIYVMKSIFNVLTSVSIMSCCVCYFYMIINVNNQKQVKYTIISLLIIGFSAIISIYNSLWETLFSPGSTSFVFYKSFFEILMFLCICIYSSYISSQSSEDRNSAVYYCSITCSCAILLLLVDTLENLECYNSNLDLSFGVRSATKLAVSFTMTSLHFPQIAVKKGGRTKRRRNQYRRQSAQSKYSVDNIFPEDEEESANENKSEEIKTEEQEEQPKEVTDLI